MNFLLKTYFKLTAYLPRKLPTTPEEYARFKHMLLKYYDVADEPKTWATVAGQVTSTPHYSIRKSFGVIANTVKRLEINALAQQDRVLAFEAINARLVKDAEAYVAEEKAKEATVTLMKDTSVIQDGVSS